MGNACAKDEKKVIIIQNGVENIFTLIYKIEINQQCKVELQTQQESQEQKYVIYISYNDIKLNTDNNDNKSTILDYIINNDRKVYKENSEVIFIKILDYNLNKRTSLMKIKYDTMELQ